MNTFLKLIFDIGLILIGTFTELFGYSIFYYNTYDTLIRYHREECIQQVFRYCW